MLVRGLTKEQLTLAASKTPVEIRELRKDGRGLRFIIKPLHGKYQRTSASYFHRGRRVHAVCWHGHRDFYRNLFAINPDAVIITAIARYNGLNDFEAKYPLTNKDIGPSISPILYSDCCDWDSHPVKEVLGHADRDAALG